MQRHRLERDRNKRRDRARAHLDRRRRDRDERPAARVRPGPRLALIATPALLAGLWLGEPVAELATGMGSQRVERIAVRGATRLAPSDVARASGVARDAALGDVDTEALSRALETHDWIATARTLRVPGGTVVLSVVEREPAATIEVERAVYAVDTEGRAFTPLPDPPALPRLVATDVTLREPDPRLAEAVRLAGRLPELGLSPASEVHVAPDGDPEGYAIRLEGLPARVVLGRAELDARLEDLARLVSVRPNEVARATDIDLRFADQVVLRGPSAREGSTSSATAGGRLSSQIGQPAG